MKFPRQEYWSGLPCPPPGNLPHPGTEHISLVPPALVSRFFTTIATWEALRSHAAAKSLQSCPTVWPHRRQPTRLPRPWDSPGKNTGVGCQFLLQCMSVKSESEVAQSCPTPTIYQDNYQVTTDISKPHPFLFTMVSPAALFERSG